MIYSLRGKAAILGKALLRRIVLPPISVTFEPTTLCNLKCQICYRWYYESPSKGKHLTLPMYKEALRNVLRGREWMPSVAFIGNSGEPLMNPAFNNLIEHNSSRYIASTFTTNGSLVTSSDIAFWKKNRVDRVTVSVDSCEPDIYESIRIGASFNKMKSVCEAISRAGLFLQINTLIYEKNVDKVLDFAKFAVGLGAKRIYYLKPHYLEDADRSSKSFRTPQRDALFKQVQAYLTSKHVEWTPPASLESHFRLCTQPFASPSIEIDGSVKSCCEGFGSYSEDIQGNQFSIDGDKFTLGNIYKEDFLKIWYGRKAKVLRKFIRDTDVKEGTQVSWEQIIEWRKNPPTNNPFEQCRTCFNRWGLQG